MTEREIGHRARCFCGWTSDWFPISVKSEPEELLEDHLDEEHDGELGVFAEWRPE